MITPVQKDEAFAKDFGEADPVTGALHVWWTGHSGFLVKWNGVGVLFDPCLTDSVIRLYSSTDRPLERVSERVVDPVKLAGVDFVVCSGNSPDRFDPETILALRAANPMVKLILPAGLAADAESLLGSAAPPLLPLNAGTYLTAGTLTFHGITAATPSIRRDAAGSSLELGCVANLGPFSIFHSGETVWHTHLVKELRRWPLNLAFLPINGEFNATGTGESLNGFQAAALAKAAGASLAVPAHYGLFDRCNPGTEEFESCCERLGQRYRVLRLGQRMTMGPVTDPGAGKAPPSEPFAADWNLGY